MRSSDFKEPHQKLNFLLCYRTTPHTTNVVPCELFLQRKMQTRLDLLRPVLTATVFQKQAGQKDRHEHHSRRREFFAGQRVLARNLRDGPRWVLGTIVQRRGPLSYLVQAADGVIWRRHVDHLLETTDSSQEEAESESPQEEAEPNITLLNEAESNTTPVLSDSANPSSPLTLPTDISPVVPSIKVSSTSREADVFSDNNQPAERVLHHPLQLHRPGATLNVYENLQTAFIINSCDFIL